MAVKTYAKTDKTKLSNNFSIPEFRCGLGSPCSACTTTLIDGTLVEFLQKIHDHFNAAVTITSGYRCTAYNKRVGGATGSYHSKGQAADIVVSGVAPAKVAAYAESIGVLGIGLYESASDGYFVHIDTRTSKSFWYGQAQAYRSTFGGATASNTTTTTKTDSGGSYGLADFIKDIQTACGAAVDGKAGAETLSKTVTLSANKNARHAAVKSVQKRLNALGYNAGDADGIAGVKFTAAVKAFQKANGCVSDGVITTNNKTWRKLLGMA